MRNYFDYWYKRTLKDGLKSMRTVVGLGLSVTLGFLVHIVVGILVFVYVLLDTLVDRN